MSDTKLADHNVGKCATCGKENQILEMRRGIGLLCPTCLFTNDSIAKKTETIVSELVKESRERDDAVLVRQDLFNAATVSLIELVTSINNNPAYDTPEKKEYAVAAEVKLRVEKLNEVIFSKEEDLLKLKNERYQLVRNIQEIASKFRTAAREALKEYDNNYNPEVFKPKKAKEHKEKVVKHRKQKSASANFNLAEYKAAADKYKVNHQVVRMMAVQKNMTAEQAAEFVSKDPALSKVSPELEVKIKAN